MGFKFLKISSSFVNICEELLSAPTKVGRV